MLRYYRIDVSAGIENNKTDGSCECIICHYCYFLVMKFRFEPNGCNGCYHMKQNPRA